MAFLGQGCGFHQPEQKILERDGICMRDGVFFQFKRKSVEWRSHLWGGWGFHQFEQKSLEREWILGTGEGGFYCPNKHLWSEDDVYGAGTGSTSLNNAFVGTGRFIESCLTTALMLRYRSPC